MEARRVSFQVVACSLPGFAGVRIAQAAYRCGNIGAISLESCGVEETTEALKKLSASGCDFTISIAALDATIGGFIERFARAGLTQVILCEPSPGRLHSDIDTLHSHQIQVLAQVTSLEEAQAAEQNRADGLIVKGNESGGRVGEETTLILLQRIIPKVRIPVFARGGIGKHTAAAAAAAGAAGVVLDWQLALCEESELPESVKSRVARMDGSETAILGQDCALRFRVYARPGESAYLELRELEDRLGLHAQTGADVLASWKKAVESRSAREELLLVGQDAAFAAALADEYRTAGAICQAIRREALRQTRVARSRDALREGGPLAESHGTRYPIVQGPMTRVSDNADFALAVAEGGGLPFLALALMGGTEVGRLLEETRQKLGDRPWGIGILGFVPKELREIQLAEARKYLPPFAVIAGGRPDQAKALEAQGTRTYLHVPSPELLRNFLENGARRVVFEGRECGGHVGPRTSFVLWELMIRVMLNHLDRSGASRAEDYHVLFAGGIHDSLSAAMVSAIAAPLTERGVRIGVLLGTGYLFTQEAVASGAIAEGFQQEAIRCTQTILVHSGVGHATRCADTPFGEHFSERKRHLLEAGRPKEEIRTELERLNLGRLRIAAKGIARGEPRPDGSPTYRRVDEQEQRRDGMYMIGQVAALRDSVCSIAELHQSVSQASKALRSRAGQIRPSSRSSDIAIIGISCVLPKANDSAAYWRNILNKVNAIEEVPKERWNVDLYFDADRRAQDRVYSRWGGFIDRIAFDPVRYGMPPTSVSAVEPLQLLTLELVRQALEDARLADRRFDRERTSVVIGTGGGVGDVGLGYGFRSLIPHFLDLAGGSREDADELIARLGDQLPHWTEDSFAGLLLNVVAGRVANRFDFGGANYVVDAACATSLAALRLGAAELASGSSDLVIVGGSDTMQSPFGYLCFSKTQALSPTGQCRTFDESADGIVISEGIGIAVMRRLDDAIREGDRIYAVLKGVGASSDGKDKGLTAPRPIGQIRALERAYAQAGIAPNTVGLIEAHGTGTVVGDRTEVESLTSFLKSAGAERQSCALGSVKSMIGHTKCTAGFAGLLKAVLALHHKVLPPTVGITKPNSKANFPESPVYLNTEARPWFRRGGDVPRRAGVSAFGFGGTNFHAVLEEYDPPEGASFNDSPLSEWPSELFLWRGKTAAEILGSIEAIGGELALGAKPLLRDLAAAVYWRHGRQTGEHCLAVVATSIEDLSLKLSAAKAAIPPGAFEDPRGVYYSPNVAPAGGKIAFVFPGQGSQRVAMLTDLALAFPQARTAFEEADRSLGNELGRPLSAFIFPPPVFTEEESAQNEDRLRQTRVAQPALGAAGIAMHRLLLNLGIHPDMVCGHSYGEFVALCAAGAISFDDLIKVSEARGRYIVEAAREEPGTMAAIEADEAEVAAMLEGIQGASIANLNAPAQTVISGTREAVTRALKELASKGITGKLIPVACAFHSELVAGAQDPLRRSLDQCALRPPRVPVFSNTTATAHSMDPDQTRTRLVEHLLRPVRFAGEILAMYESGARVFIEAGPGRVLTGLIDRILADRPFKAIAMDQPGRNGLLHLTHALARLATAGVPLLAWRLFEGRITRTLNLDRLADETRPAAAPATAWMVGSGRAFPAYGPKAETPRPAAVNGMANVVKTSPVAAPLAGGAHHTNGSTDAVMKSHHELMSKFLETHKKLMLAYTSGAGARSGLQIEAQTTRIEAQTNGHAATPAPVLSESPAPIEAKPQIVPTQDAIVSRLVDLVSERTGYPRETLALDLDLEADLGIDSIKRVEILGALESGSLLAGANLEGEIETLSKLKTLRAIAEWITARAGQPLPPGVQTDRPAAHLEAQSPEEALCRMVVKAAEVSRPPVKPFDGRGLVVITDDGTGLATLLARRLGELGTPSELVTAEQIQNFNRAAIPVGALVHLLPMGGSAESGLDGFRARFDREVMSLFHLARALETDLRSESGLVLAATRLGGAFAVGGASTTEFCPVSGAISGFIKSLSREWPAVAARTVDFEDSATNEQIVEALLCEMGVRDGLLEAGYRNSERVAPVPVEEPVSTSPSALRLDRDSVIVIIGGARGITAEIAMELAARFRPRLILVGRSPMPVEKEPPELEQANDEKSLKTILLERLGEPSAVEREWRRIRRDREIRSNLQAIAGAGAAVEYHSADVTDETGFGALLDSIYERFGRIDGVIHGAGVIEDKFIRDKSPESFRRVVDPKVTGALVLCRKLRPESLQFLVFFSSVSARYGNRGQSDYAAANEALNKLAVWLSARWPARVVSINWGPWKSEGGMVTAELAERFSKAGVQLVSPLAGRKAFLDELLYGGRDNAEVIWGGPRPQAQKDAARQFPFLSRSGVAPKRTNGSLELVLETGPHEDLYQLDHQLDGTPVMPMAMILELAAEIAEQQWQGMRASKIRDVRVLKGITYPSGSQHTLNVNATAVSSSPQGPVILDVAVKSEAGGRNPHYRAQVELIRNTIKPFSAPRLELIDPRPLPVTLAEAYQSWLFHGPLFAGIAKVDALGANGIAGDLRCSSPARYFRSKPGGAWLIDPVIIDSGFQLVILWVRTYLDQTPLPSRLGCCHIFGSFSSDRVRCEVSINGTRGNPTMRSDLRFFDESGRLLVWLEDMQFTSSRTLNRLSLARAASAVEAH